MTDNKPRVDDEVLKKIKPIMGRLQGSFHGSFVSKGTKLVVVAPDQGQLKPGDIVTVERVIGRHMVSVEEDAKWHYQSHELGLLPEKAE